MFKFSNYIEVVDDPVNDKHRVSLFSYRSKTVSKIYGVDYDLITQAKFDCVKPELLEELIRNKILVRHDESEVELLANELLSYDKITVVVKDASVIDFERLFSILEKKRITLVSFLFYDCGEDVISTTMADQRVAFQKYGINTKCRFFSLVSHQAALHLGEITMSEGYTHCKQVLKQIIVEDTPQTDINKFERGSEKVKLSIFKDDEFLYSQHSEHVVFFRQQHHASVVASAQPYLKELPISGLIAEVSQLPVIEQQKLNKHCCRCTSLPACGGYLEGSQVQCPSYTHFSFEWKKLLPLILKKQFSEEREKRRLDMLNDAGIVMLNEFISANEPLENRLYSAYMVSEFDRGFLLSKAKAFNNAMMVFAMADQRLNALDKETFLYKFTQLWATSTKSYLAYKQGGFERAVEILRLGIRFGLSIQHYQKAEVLALYFIQMLYNVGKVYLIARLYDKWQHTIAQIFNLLLNFDVPDECEGMDVKLIKNLDSRLRYKTVVPIISDILYRKETALKPYRDALLAGIQIRNISNNFENKIQCFADLYKALLKGNESYLTATLPAFYDNSEKDPLVSSLQVLFRIKNKDMLGKLQHTVSA